MSNKPNQSTVSPSDAASVSTSTASTPKKLRSQSQNPNVNLEAVTVATVLKTGGAYTPEYVEKLKRAFERHLPTPHKFVCLTNEPFADYCIPLLHDWKGYWAKMELFRPGLLTGRVLFVDLDTVILNDVSALLNHDKRFVMLTNPGSKTELNSCLMYWDTDNSFLYERFSAEPERIMSSKHYFYPARIGDQGFIQARMAEAKRSVETWWKILPAPFFIHFQDDVLKGRSWGSASICWWSQGPKPHAVRAHPLIKEHWV